MSLADFSTLADAIQSILIGLAVIIGGVWALFRFWSLREAEKANAELKALKKSLEERPTFKVVIEASRLGATGKFPTQLLTKIVVYNLGNRSDVIDWSQSRLLVSKVARFEGGKVEYEIPSYLKPSSPDITLISTSIDPREEESFHILVPVPEPGTYYLEFTANVSARTALQAESIHIDAGLTIGQLLWSADTYVLVE